MIPRKHRICWLLISICVLSACVGNAETAAWDGAQYINQQSGIQFSLPENWIMNPAGTAPNPFFDVIVSDETGANAIAIGFIDLTELIKLIPSDVLGPYAGLLGQIDINMIDEDTIMRFMASMLASGAFGAESDVQSESVHVGENEYTMISVALYDGALLQSILIRSFEKQISVILFSSSDQTEAEWFLSHFF